jgi:hypothetical protein
VTEHGDEVPGPAGQVLISRPVLAGYLGDQPAPWCAGGAELDRAGLISSSIAIQAPARISEVG